MSGDKGRSIVERVRKAAAIWADARATADMTALEYGREDGAFDIADERADEQELRYHALLKEYAKESAADKTESQR